MNCLSGPVSLSFCGSKQLSDILSCTVRKKKTTSNDFERGHLIQQQILLSNSTQTYQEHAQNPSTEKRIFVPTTSTLEVTIQNPGKKILSNGESPQICNKKLLFWFQLNLNSKAEKQLSFHFSPCSLFSWWLIFAVSNYRNLQPC